MTCEEARKLYALDPFTLTAAERAAALGHAESCRECGDAVRERSERARAKLTDEENEKIDSECGEQIRRDFTDPKAMNTYLKATKGA